MFALLHLDLVSSRDELLIKSDVRYSMRATLANDLKGVRNACHYIASEVNASFDHTDSALDGSFDESF